MLIPRCTVREMPGNVKGSRIGTFNVVNGNGIGEFTDIYTRPNLEHLTACIP